MRAAEPAPSGPRPIGTGAAWSKAVPRRLHLSLTLFAAAAALALLVACERPSQQHSAAVAAVPVEFAVRGASLSSGRMAQYVGEPGLYVDLYRPHGALDFLAPLPFHYTLLNTSDTSFDPWEFSFEFDGAIDHAWNATITLEDGRFVVRPDDWNAALPSGQTRQFGFVGRSNDRYRPGPDGHSYLLGGTVVEPRGVVAAISHEECQLEVDFVVHADGQWWNTEPHSYFGEFYLRNIGAQPADWALRWSMDHRGASGPGTRTVGSAQRLVGGDYYLRSSSFEGPIEPGGTRSFAIWGAYSRQPYDLAPCPQGVLVAPDPAAEAYSRAHAALSDEEKRAVACGSLVWNGTSFLVRSPLSGMAPPCR